MHKQQPLKCRECLNFREKKNNKLKHSLSSKVIPYWGFCSELEGCVRVVYISGAHHELSFSRTSQLAPWGGAPPRNRGSMPSSSEKDHSLGYIILQFSRVAFKSLEKKPLGFQVILLKGFQSWPALLAYLPDIRHQIWPEFSFENISTLVTPILLIAKPKPSLWPARPPVVRRLPTLRISLLPPLRPHLILFCFVQSPKPVPALGPPPHWALCLELFLRTITGLAPSPV